MLAALVRIWRFTGWAGKVSRRTSWATMTLEIAAAVLAR
jgi:hypothetical protein